MAFNPDKYDVHIWLELKNNGQLPKKYSVANASGAIETVYATRYDIVPVGQPKPNGKISISAPCLAISYSYDANGNITAEKAEMVEWLQAYEDAINAAPVAGGSTKCSDLLPGVDYDTISYAYPNALTEEITYNKGVDVVRVVTVTYLTSDKNDIDTVVFA